MPANIPRIFKNRPKPSTTTCVQSEAHRALLEAWEVASEIVKIQLTQAIYQHFPSTFKNWYQGANITGFTPKMLATRPHDMRCRLDNHARKNPDVLRYAAIAYFTKTAPAINEFFLAKMHELGITQEHGNPVIVDEVLAEMQAIWNPEEPAYAELFSATLRLTNPEWWRESLLSEDCNGGGPVEPTVATPSALDEGGIDAEGRISCDSELTTIEPVRTPGSTSVMDHSEAVVSPAAAIPLLPPPSGDPSPAMASYAGARGLWCFQADLSPALASLASQIQTLTSERLAAISSQEMKTLASCVEVLEANTMNQLDPGMSCGAPQDVREACAVFQSVMARGILGTEVPGALRMFHETFDRFQAQHRLASAELAGRQDDLRITPYTAEQPVPCTFLGEALHELDKYRASLNEMEANCRKQLWERVCALNIYHLNTERTARLEALRSTLESGGSVRTIEDGLKALETELAKDPKACHPDQLARALLEMNFKGPILVSLGRALLESGDSSLALIYFRSMQEIPVEESGLEDFSLFVESLLLCLVAQGGAGGWIDHLRDQPWLTTLYRADIQEERVVAALAGLLMVAELRYPGSFTHLWNCFRGPLSCTPTLGRLAEAITVHQPWCWMDPERIAKLAASERELDVSTSQVLANMQKVHRRFREFFRKAQGALKEAWGDVRVGRPVRLDPQQLCEEFAAEARGEDCETYLCKTFNGEIQDFFKGLEAHAELLRSHHEVPALQLDRRTLHAELTNLANGDSGLQLIWVKVAEALDASSSEPFPDFSRSPVVALALGSDTFTQLLPEGINRFNGDLSAGLHTGDFRLMVERLARPIPIREVVSILEASRSLRQIKRLMEQQGLNVPQITLESVVAQLIQRIERLSAIDNRPDLLRALEEGRFRWVERMVSAAESTQEQGRLALSTRINERIVDLKKVIQGLEDQANASQGDEAWKDQTQVALTDLIQRLNRASRPQQTVEEKQRTLDGIDQILDLVKDHVCYLGQDFRLLEFPVIPAATAEPELLEPWPGDEDRAPLWALMEALGVEADPKVVRKQVESFLLGFAKATKMYCNPPDRCKLASGVGSPFQYLQTSFHKPGSEAFNRPIHIFLLPGPNPSKDLLERVRRGVDESRGQVITLLLLPGEAKTAQRYFERDLKAGRLILLDRPLIEQTLAAEQAHKPLRQLLRRRISLEQASPFLSTGNLDKDAHLYVPIGKIEGRILNGHSWLILGGRRSGKSTLLQAVKKALLNKKQPYRCAFVSLESMADKLARDGNPDLLVAREIAQQFGWDYPENASDLAFFESTLRNQCATTRTCILLDELDPYIQWHRSQEQNRYPVIRCLRNVSQASPRGVSDNLVCLFAGFKDLLRAWKEPNSEDSSYPWGNWLKEIYMPQLNLPETKALVEEGFVDVLGLEMDPVVPNYIFRYTAGHPAFVQELCNCILGRLERQGHSSDRIRVTLEEVKNAYSFIGSQAEGRSFIHYVQITLDLNLSSLDKVFAYMIAVNLIAPDEDFLAPKSQSEIYDEAEYWFTQCQRKVPSEKRMKEALENLEMTGMLTPVNNGRFFRMTFASFVEILRRLEEADKETIFRLIADLEA